MGRKLTGDPAIDAHAEVLAEMGLVGKYGGGCYCVCKDAKNKAGSADVYEMSLLSEDRSANDRALRTGDRLLSAYKRGADKLWIITEADRSSTTFLLPEEY